MLVEECDVMNTISIIAMLDWLLNSLRSQQNTFLYDNVDNVVNLVFVELFFKLIKGNQSRV